MNWGVALADFLDDWEARQPPKPKAEVLVIDFARPFGHASKSYERELDSTTLKWCQKCMRVCSGPHPESAREE